MGEQKRARFKTDKDLKHWNILETFKMALTLELDLSVCDNRDELVERINTLQKDFEKQ